jgi:hypothetical protein
VSVLEVVLDLFSFSEIDGIFSDISRKVGDALEIPAHEQELERWSDRSGILHHVREKNTKNRVVKRVYCIICLAHFAPQ